MVRLLHQGFFLRRRIAGCRNYFQLPDEPITAARNCLHVPRRSRGIPEDFTNPVYGVIYPMIEIDEGVFRPELAAQFLTRDKFALPADEIDQQLGRLQGKLLVSSATL